MFSTVFGLALACAAIAASNAREAKPLREAVVGTWTLVSSCTLFHPLTSRRSEHTIFTRFGSGLGEKTLLRRA